MAVVLVDLEERYGASPGITSYRSTDGYVHVLAEDRASLSDPVGYQDAPLGNRIDGQTVYSAERWLRLRFRTPFRYVQNFSFWCPGLTVPAGWSFLWGTRSSYQTPTVYKISPIAVSAVPTTGPVAANIGGGIPLEGSQEQFSDWVVLQASVTANAAVGPMVSMITYKFAWEEVV